MRHEAGFEWGTNYQVQSATTTESSFGVRLQPSGDPNVTSTQLGEWFRLTTDKTTRTAHLMLATDHQPVPDGPIKVTGIERLVISFEVPS